MSEIVPWIKLLIELGLAVYQAAKDGDGSKTVDEILGDRGLDMDLLRELDADAVRHFAQP